VLARVRARHSGSGRCCVRWRPSASPSTGASSAVRNDRPTRWAYRPRSISVSAGNASRESGVLVSAIPRAGWIQRPGSVSGKGILGRVPVVAPSPRVIPGESCGTVERRQLSEEAPLRESARKRVRLSCGVRPAEVAIAGHVPRVGVGAVRTAGPRRRRASAPKWSGGQSGSAGTVARASKRQRGRVMIGVPAALLRVVSSDIEAWAFAGDIDSTQRELRSGAALTGPPRVGQLLNIRPAGPDVDNPPWPRKVIRADDTPQTLWAKSRMHARLRESRVGTLIGEVVRDRRPQRR
jgi:hypothetical protein